VLIILICFWEITQPKWWLLYQFHSPLLFAFLLMKSAVFRQTFGHWTMMYHVDGACVSGGSLNNLNTLTPSERQEGILTVQ